MLVVISDLHFQDNVSDNLRNRKKPEFDRNISPEAFQKTFADISKLALDSHAQSVEIMLAGDIFDLHRTQHWFINDNPIRPYVDCKEVSPELQTTLLHILDIISKQESVAKCLTFIREIGQVFKNADGHPIPTTVHYMPGNHDRLLNATPALRAKVIELLGMHHHDPAQSFTHSFTYTLNLKGKSRFALVRHGHEYDRVNFSLDYSEGQVPKDIPDEAYDKPTVGDYVTVDFASRLPYEFRKYHEEHILHNPHMQEIYRRLLEFDDVRPQGTMLNFVLSLNHKGLSREFIWELIKPAMKKVLEIAQNSPFLKKETRPFSAVQIMLWSRLWKLIDTLPLSLIESQFERLLGSPTHPDPATFALREEAVEQGQASFVIAGHTHAPQLAFLTEKQHHESYFVDTGTWRNRYEASAAQNAFGHTKAITYVAIYRHDETPNGESHHSGKMESFDYWSGQKRRWG